MGTNVQYGDTPDYPARQLSTWPVQDQDIAVDVKGFYVTGAGSIVITAVGDTVPVTMGVAANTYHPIKAKRIAAASTATGIVLLF